MEQFEELLHDDLHRYLLSVNEVDERLPECADVEDKWAPIAQAYLPDGIREYPHYPVVSMGWMMYLGMAVAWMWDADWDKYSRLDDLYVSLRDKRGYDYMDEYIREEMLLLKGDLFEKTERIVSECASRINNALVRRRFEPGTREAFDGYVSCLHQLYLMGAAMQMKRMGYHMTLHT